MKSRWVFKALDLAHLRLQLVLDARSQVLSSLTTGSRHEDTSNMSTESRQASVSSRVQAAFQSWVGNERHMSLFPMTRVFFELLEVWAPGDIDRLGPSLQLK